MEDLFDDANWPDNQQGLEPADELFPEGMWDSSMNDSALGNSAGSVDAFLADANFHPSHISVDTSDENEH